MVMQPVSGFVLALALAVVHVVAGRITGHERVPSEPLVSFAGGTTIAYVFVLILPELNEAVVRITESRGDVGGFLALDTLVYLTVMSGFLAFYGVHVFVTTALRESAHTSALTFWTHVASFALYNALIGYLLFHRTEETLLGQFLYAVAMGFHFLVVDAGFRRHHEAAYHRLGRWILAGSVVVGAGVGFATNVSEPVVILQFALLAGSIVFNVLNEELPNVEWARFGSFLGGVVCYTAVLLLF